MTKNKKRPFEVGMVMEGEVAVLTLSGVIGWDEGADAISFCDAVDNAVKAGAQSITLRINSVGGVCYDGLAMGDKLATCGVPVRGEVVGSAQSMAAYLLQCCTVRVAHRHATVMLHQPRGGCFGTVDEMAEEVRHLCAMRDEMFAVMGKRCGVDGAALSDEHRHQKSYTAREALAKGLLDAIAGEEPDEGAEGGETGEDEPAASAAARAGMRGFVPMEQMGRMLAMMGGDAEDEPVGDAEDAAADEGGAEAAEDEPAADAADAEGEDEEEKISDAAEAPGEQNEQRGVPAASGEAAGNPLPVMQAMPVEPVELVAVPSVGVLSDAQVAEIAARAAAEAVAALGLPPAAVPAAVAVAPAPRRAAAAVPTRAQMERMHSLQLLQLLQDSPEARAVYYGAEMAAGMARETARGY